MTMTITQQQLYQQARQEDAAQKRLFLEFVRDGLTREELQANIARRPELWGKYVNWLDKLPSEVEGV